jgi:hypothetical protein
MVLHSMPIELTLKYKINLSEYSVVGWNDDFEKCEYQDVTY